MSEEPAGFLKSELDALRLRIAANVVAFFPADAIRAHILANLERWKRGGVWGPAYDEWNRLASAADDATLVQAMLGLDERAVQLRQSPPYVGMLSDERIRDLKAGLRQGGHTDATPASTHDARVRGDRQRS